MARNNQLINSYWGREAVSSHLCGPFQDSNLGPPLEGDFNTSHLRNSNDLPKNVA